MWFQLQMKKIYMIIMNSMSFINLTMKNRIPSSRNESEFLWNLGEKLQFLLLKTKMTRTAITNHLLFLDQQFKELFKRMKVFQK